MFPLRILYLRDDKAHDSLIMTALKPLDNEIIIEFGILSDLVNFHNSCYFQSKCNFDVILVLCEDCKNMKKMVENLPAHSIIQICDNESYNGRFEWINSKFFEQFSLAGLREHPEALRREILKNTALMQKFYENHSLVNTIFNIIPNGMTLFSMDGRIIYTNAHITGHDPEYMIGKSIFDFLKKESRKKIEKLMERALFGEKTAQFKTRVIDKDGNTLPVEINGTLLMNNKGEPLYYLAILTDIRVEKEVWEKGQFLANIIDSSRDGIIATDREGRITIWNKGDTDIFQYTAEEMIGKNLSLLCPDKDHAIKQKKYLKKARKDGYLKNLVVQRHRKDGEIIEVEINITAIYDKEHNFIGTIGVIRDVSRTKRALEVVQKKNEEMEHLINVVSHDLRAPLHSINNYLCFIRDSIRGKVTDDDVFEMFERTHANISNMESLITDLTNFSRAGLQSGDEVALDLNSLLNDIIINIQWQVGRENFLIEMDKLPTVRIDYRRIQQVFQNLLTNAYNFRREGEPAKAEIRVERDNKMVKFLVKDNGIGIEKKHHSRIFGLFYRTKEKEVEGSGAGLAIAKKVINSYGGDIWFKSSPDEGTTFYFTLPASLLKEEDTEE